MNKSLISFKNHYEKLRKEYGKKLDTNLFNLDTLDFSNDEVLLKQIKIVEELSLIDSCTLNKELHIELLTFIDDFVSIMHKRKYSLKQFETFLSACIALNHRYEEATEGEGKERVIDAPREFYGDNLLTLMKEVAFAYYSVEKYVDHLVSKTVDYLPEDLKSRSQIELVLNQFINFKTYLEEIASDISPLWVYCFTETTSYAPFSLRYLDSLDKLGQRLENWMDYSRESSLVRLCNQKGFNIFGGWGSLSGKLIFKEGKTLEEPKPEPYRKVMTNDQARKAAGWMLDHVPMYALNSKFNVYNAQHRGLLLRTLALAVDNDLEITEEQLDKCVGSCRDLMAKNYRSIYIRDKRNWFLEKDKENLRIFIEEQRKDRPFQLATFIMKTTFDHATPHMYNPETFIRSVVALHQYLYQSYNLIFCSQSPFTKEQLQRALDITQNFYIPRYKQLIPEDRQWILTAAMEFWLDIFHQGKVDTTIKYLREHFGKRNTRELNNEFYEANKYYLMFLSLKNKQAIREEIERNPIEVVSYNGSKEVYEKIMLLITNDLDNPVMDNRVIGVEVTDDGIIAVNKLTEQPA